MRLIGQLGGLLRTVPLTSELIRLSSPASTVEAITLANLLDLSPGFSPDSGLIIEFKIDL